MILTVTKQTKAVINTEKNVSVQEGNVIIVYIITAVNNRADCNNIHNEYLFRQIS